MSEKGITTIQISEETWQDLNSRKRPGMTFDDVIRSLLEETEE